MNSYITELLRDMRQNMEVTHEFHMMGALNGKVVNPDTTTIHNLFTLFGLTENSIDINFASASLEFMLTCSEITRYVQDSLGGTPNSGIMVLCGDTFYDNLTTLQEIKDAYNRPGQGEFLRTNHARKFIDYGNIRWVNYRGRVGNVTFLEDTQARVVPLGVPKMFIRKNGPDDTMNGVGKPGPKYKVTRKQYDHDGGWEFKAQSNPLIIATRPQCLIKLNDTTP